MISDIEYQVFIKDAGDSDDYWDSATDGMSSEQYAIETVKEMQEDDAANGEKYDYKIVKYFTTQKDHKLFLFQEKKGE